MSIFVYVLCVEIFSQKKTIQKPLFRDKVLRVVIFYRVLSVKKIHQQKRLDIIGY